MKNPKTKIILIAGFFFVGIILIFILVNKLWSASTNTDYLVPNETISQEYWQRKISEIPITPNTKKLLNPYDKYSLEIPLEWLVPGNKTVSSNTLGIYLKNTFYEKSGIIDLAEVVPILSIKIFDSELSLSNWVENEGPKLLQYTKVQKITINNMPAHVSFGNLRDEEGKPILGTIKTTYIIQNESKLYALICALKKSNTMEQAKQCDEAVQTFRFLE